MAGVLYLFRLLVNHRDYGTKSADNHVLLSGMEARLWRVITVPAMVVTLLAGLAMIGQNPDLLNTGWLPTKLAGVIGLIAVTFYGKKLIDRAAMDPHTLPVSKTLRILNEIPTLLMMLIIWLVVFKPF